jgi:hypothetical protein
MWRNVAALIWNGKGNACEVRGVGGADQMQRGDAGGVDQAAIEGIDGPGAVELEATSGACCGRGDVHGVERFDGMDLDAGQVGKYWLGLHGIILTEWLPAHCPPSPLRNECANLRRAK